MGSAELTGSKRPAAELRDSGSFGVAGEAGPKDRVKLDKIGKDLAWLWYAIELPIAADVV